MDTTADQDLPTRERLLRAAERLFAKKGYEHTSVRDITEAAGANVAAVNYHFGSKQNLYREIFRDHSAAMTEIREAAFGPRGPVGELPPLPEALRAFVRMFLGRMLRGAAEGGLFFRVVAREMESPGPAFDILVAEMIRPTQETLQAAVLREVPGMTPARATLCVASLMGQMIHFVRARRVISELLGRAYTDALVEELCEHVASFTLAGMGVRE